MHGGRRNFNAYAWILSPWWSLSKMLFILFVGFSFLARWLNELSKDTASNSVKSVEASWFHNVDEGAADAKQNQGVFCDARGIVHYEYASEGQTVTKDKGVLSRFSLATPWHSSKDQRCGRRRTGACIMTTPLHIRPNWSTPS